MNKDDNRVPETWSQVIEELYVEFLAQFRRAPDGILVGSRTYEMLVKEASKTSNIKFEDILFWRGIKVRKANFFVTGLMFLIDASSIKGEDPHPSTQDWSIEIRRQQ